MTCGSVCTGYVDTMKKLLFSLTDAERKEVLEKYSSKQPEPLNRQFLKRKSKEEAVEDYRARQTQTHRRPVCKPKPDADLCMRVDLPLDKKLWKMRIGPPGRGPLGLRAVRPLSRRGPWAVGRWAAGLLLANPVMLLDNKRLP